VIAATAVMDEMDVAMIVVVTVVETVVVTVVVTVASVLIAAVATIAAVVLVAMNAPTVADVSNVDLLVDEDQDPPPSCMSDSAAKLASVPKT
jgi:hypothetical protein